MTTFTRPHESGITVESFGWLPNGEAQAFASIVKPSLEVAQRAPVVIVGPYGVEALGADRTLRELGVALLRQGHLVVHIEPPDVGDGAGNQNEPGRLGRWIAAVNDAIAWCTQTGQAPIVIGVRLGAIPATIASDHAAGLVLWAPVVSGRKYVRELKLASASRAHTPAPMIVPTTSQPDDLEAGGFVMPADFAADVSSVDLIAVHPGAKRVLIIDRDDVASARPLIDAWRALVGTNVDAPSVTGFAATMIDDPERGEVALAVNSTIVETCTSWSYVHPLPLRKHDGCTTPLLNQISIGNVVDERTIAIGANRDLLGIVTHPSHAPRNGPAIVILSTGSNARSGPGRLATTMARRWAERGTTVLRYDRRGIGASATQVEPSPSPGFTVGNAYAQQHVRDLIDVLRWVRAHGHHEVVLVGMCSGAWLGYQAITMTLPTDAAKPVGLVAINQVIWDDLNWAGEGESPAIAAKAGRELKRAIVDPARWLDLVRGEIPVFANLGRLSRLAVMMTQRKFGRYHSVFAEQLDDIASRGIWQLQFFDAEELGPAYLRMQCEATIAKHRATGAITRLDTAGAGHTFSQQPAKDWLLAAIDAHLEQRGVFALSADIRG